MANIIIKSDERRRQEADMLKAFGGGDPRNGANLNREYAEEINARMDDIYRKAGMR